MEIQLLPENYNHGDKNKTESDSGCKFDQSIKNIVKKEGYIDYQVYKKCLSTNGGNYLGVLYEIDVKGTTKYGNKELNLFAKNVIKSESVKMISVDSVYKTELFAYKELSKIFADLQEQARVPVNERYKMVKVYDESNTEAIILENITKKGFTTYYRMDTMSLDFIEHCVKQLARFHGLSFVIKEKMPEFFAKKIKPLKNAFNFDEEWVKMCRSVKEIGLRNTDEDIRDKLERAYDRLIVKFVQYVNDESTKTCLCHGDYRPNNIMTKINNDGTVLEIIPVDYQLLHYGSPVFDFLYLLFVSTDRKFRKAHTSHLKDLYYETLSTFLGYFNLDPNVVYSRDEFEKYYKEKLDLGLMFGLVFLPFILASETDVPDINVDVSKLIFTVNDTFRIRIREIIEEYVELGWL